LSAFYFTLMKTRIPSFLITLLVCLGFSQNAHPVTPAPDGGYPGGNTAEGDNALLSLTSGGYNTALGLRSLQKDTEGNFNTAIGAGALLVNNTAAENTATGAGALLSNAPGFASGGNGNTANGAFALVNNGTGSLNTAIGDRALFNDVSGSNNIALGDSAGFSVTTASHVICIGLAGANQSNSCFIGQIFGASAPGGVSVFINSSGRLSAPGSSRRFKEDIKPMERASEVIFALKPVTFCYKKELDPQGVLQFGLVAEDVEQVNPGLVVRDNEGKTYGVRYDQINTMLLNEFLKDHRKLHEQEATIAQLKKDFRANLAQLTAQLKEQAAQIQKVSAQLEASKTPPQVVSNR